jgi:hypothetical protein
MGGARQRSGRRPRLRVASVLGSIILHGEKMDAVVRFKQRESVGCMVVHGQHGKWPGLSLGSGLVGLAGGADKGEARPPMDGVDGLDAISREKSGGGDGATPRAWAD